MSLWRDIQRDSNTLDYVWNNKQLIDCDCTYSVDYTVYSEV